MVVYRRCDALAEVASVGSKRLLLIVEDEPVMRMAIRASLEDLEQFELIEATDGLEALEMIDEQNPDTMVLDILLPRMDGIEVLRTLQGREEGNSPRVIVVLSALVEPNLVESLQQLGADRVMTKPFHVQEFLGVLEELTEGSA